jgi:septal ring factor EnvC (AmiA/AmiB activator)
MRRFLCIAAIFAAADAAAGPKNSARPAEALFADRAAVDAEVHDLERRARSLDQQASERRERLKKRVRALYKLSNGGSLRLLFADAGQLAVRHDAVRRILARDLDELAAVRDEARQVDAEQARRQDALARAVAIAEELEQLGSPPLPPARRLLRPVPGPILHSFGGYRDHGIEVVRRGAELQSQAAETVRAAQAGHVAWVGEAPGIGPSLALEHGDGWVSLYGRVRPSVTVGAEVSAGAVLGRAVAATLYFELAQDGTPIDPAPFLQKPQ